MAETWLHRVIFAESEAQRIRNQETCQKPEGMSWEEWENPPPGSHWDRRLGIRECHWYGPDGKPRGEGRGHCNGATHHNHQPLIMQVYWIPWVGPLLAGPFLLLDNVVCKIADLPRTRWWHRWAMRHQMVKSRGQKASRIIGDGSIAVYEQDEFRPASKHWRCECGKVWY